MRDQWTERSQLAGRRPRIRSSPGPSRVIRPASGLGSRTALATSTLRPVNPVGPVRLVRAIPAPVGALGSVSVVRVFPASVRSVGPVGSINAIGVIRATPGSLSAAGSAITGAVGSTIGGSAFTAGSLRPLSRALASLSMGAVMPFVPSVRIDAFVRTLA